MRRRDFLVTAVAASMSASAARAQQKAMPVVGLLDLRSPDAIAAIAARLDAFRQGLGDNGFVEGENVVIAYRWAENHPDRLAELTADLVRREAAVIATAGDSVPQMVKAAAPTIPIVFITGADPVKIGLVASLNRPGGNATGINDFGVEIAAKRLSADAR